MRTYIFHFPLVREMHYFSHRLEEINDNIRQRINHLNEQVKQLEDKRRHEQYARQDALSESMMERGGVFCFVCLFVFHRESFEEEMAQLIDKFRSGWQCLVRPNKN